LGGLKVRSVWGGGVARITAESSVTVGQSARWCEAEKMAEKCCERCSALQLIVYRLLVRLSLLFQMTKDLTIPKFGVLSYSSIYKQWETVLVNIFVDVICS
jgi:hypothetical protein